MFYFTGLTPLSPEFSWREAFAFGSLISATDPVSVIAIFKEMDADVNLNAIIFGESIFNDAIGIVMYQTVIEAGQGDRTVTDEFLHATGRFLLIFIGSLLIGAVSAQNRSKTKPGSQSRPFHPKTVHLGRPSSPQDALQPRTHTIIAT